MLDERPALPEDIVSQETRPYEQEVVELMEKWFPEEGIVVIGPESRLARQHSEAVATVNTIFNDLGGTLFTAADVAAEKQYRQVAHELRILGEGINAFHKDLISYSPADNREYYHKRDQKKVAKIGFRGRFIGDDGKEYHANIFIRKEPDEVLHGSRIEKTSEARFKFEISDRDDNVIAGIRIDPGNFGRVVYDLDTPSLRTGEVDLSEAGQEISDVTGKPTHHFPHPTMQLTRAKFGEILDVLDQHIRESIESRKFKRAA